VVAVVAEMMVQLQAVLMVYQVVQAEAVVEQVLILVVQIQEEQELQVKETLVLLHIHLLLHFL
jgi:hypothetical protein